MRHSAIHPTVEELRQFNPLCELNNEQLGLLASAVEILELPAHHALLKYASQDDHTYLLLKGELKLIPPDRKVRYMKAGDESAKAPISQLQPRHYDVICQTPIRYLRINNALIKDLTRQPSEDGTTDVLGYLVSGDEQSGDAQLENQLSHQLLTELEADTLTLPSLPDVAVRIGQALHDDVSDAQTIAKLVQIDPVMTAKLIKAANSAMYGRRVPVESCSSAVVRLGGDITHKLVLSYAVQELFKSKSALLQQRMKTLWQHSTRVAAICYVLAESDSRFVPEQAMLIGLLHDIGVVAILSYAGQQDPARLNPDALERTIRHLRGQVGGIILSKWGFSSEFVMAALQGEHWMRDEGSQPDYCDLVIIAQLHSFIGTKAAMDAPAIDQIPAHNRLELGEITPNLSLIILEEAAEQIKNAEQLLNF